MLGVQAVGKGPDLYMNWPKTLTQEDMQILRKEWEIAGYLVGEDSWFIDEEETAKVTEIQVSDPTDDGYTIRIGTIWGRHLATYSLQDDGTWYFRSPDK